MSIISYLLAVLLLGLEGSLTYFGWRLNLSLGMFFYAVSLIFYFPIHADHNLKLQLILHNILSIVLLIICPAYIRLPILTLSTFILYFILKQKKQNYPELVIFAISVFTFFIYLIAYNYSSFVWNSVQTVSQFLSSVCSNITHYPINSNPTYTGIHISIYSLICAACAIWFIKKKRSTLFVISLVYIALMTILYIIIQFYFSNWIMHSYHSWYVQSMHGQVILFTFLSPLILFLITRTETIEAPAFKVGQRFLLKIPVFLIFFVAMFILTFQSQPENTGKNILFYDNGYLDWRLPDHSVYGAKKGGMFGMLPTYLKANNFSIKNDSVINHQNLKDRNILVIINLLQKFDLEEKQLIWDFVENGGSLFVLGDHTGFKQIREPTNDLLKPFHIELNFDCAIPFAESWKNSMYYFPHPITSSVSSNYESNIFIGASLSIGPEVRPLITGMFGFSDPGDTTAVQNAFLGNMRYIQGEQLGDQVLIAESLYGKGKVLVFGDTSPFQNSALVQSHTFVYQVFNWLAVPIKWWHKYSVYIFFIMLILALLSMLWLRLNIYDFIFISVVICIAVLINYYSVSGKKDIHQLKQVDKSLAIIDASNLERFSRDQWKDDGYGGLCYNLMRADYLPLINTSGVTESLNDCRLLVLIAPAKPFKESEISILDKYVRNGGVILIASGWEESRGSEKLLDHFGLQIENIPLGRIDSDQNKKMITFTKAWGLSCSGMNVKTVCEVWDQPTILYKQIDNGGIILIGDAGFLLNDNLEGMESYNRQNILFFKEMIKKYTSKK